MSEVADYSRGEPAPIPNNGTSMHTLAIQDLAIMGFDGYTDLAKEKLTKLIKERRDFGLKKYNTPLQANNGRNPVSDMKDELLDALVYARQYLAEDRPGKGFMIRHYDAIMNMLLDVITLESGEYL